VKICSETGQGTTVKICLPRQGEQDSRPDTIESRALSGAIGHETVRVVEDDDALRDYAADLLSEFSSKIYPEVVIPEILRKRLVMSTNIVISPIFPKRTQSILPLNAYSQGTFCCGKT
jgi:hypothetical protein